MAGSISDVSVITISDEVAASTTFVAAAARPDTAFTIANSSFASGGARNVTVTTSGTGDNAKTVTVVGTDVFGDALTEVITSTGSAVTYIHPHSAGLGLADLRRKHTHRCIITMQMVTREHILP